MLWRWVVFVFLSVSILACIISTTFDWIKGKTGPFGPAPENWWGCGIFTIFLLLVIWWVSKGILR